MPKLSQHLVLFILFCSATATNARQSEKVLHFTSSVGMPFSNTRNTGFEDKILKEVCRRIGKKVTIQYIPSERALRNLEDNLDDGSLGRVAVVTIKYPRIHQIKEPVFVQDFVAFSRDAEFQPKDWNSLAHYNVGIVTGWKILEKHIKHFKSLVKVNNGMQLFSLLSVGHVDVVVYNRWSGQYLITKMHLRGIHVLDPPLARVPIFFNLSEKNLELMQPMQRALKNMKADGTYQKIYDQTLRTIGIMTKR